MNRITLTFTANQLRELAKELYLASIITSVVNYKKENFAMTIMNKVCRAGFLEAPETGIFAQPANSDEPPFYINKELEDECTPLVDAYKEFYTAYDVFAEFVNRECIERFGKPGTVHLFADPLVGKEAIAFVTKLDEDYKTNGFANFRYVEPTADR